MKTFKEFMSEEGVVTSKDFTPFNLRNVPHIRTPYIRGQEMKDFKRFIQSMGGSWDLQVKKKKPKDSNKNSNIA